jgi:hypothetical protein
MEGEADEFVEDDLMADAGMGELGEDRLGAVGGSVDAMVESMPTVFEGDGMGVAAMLKFAGRGGSEVSSVVMSLDELKLALGGVSFANSTARAISDKSLSPNRLFTLPTTLSCCSAKSWYIVSVATGICKGSPNELATDIASHG